MNRKLRIISGAVAAMLAVAALTSCGKNPQGKSDNDLANAEIMTENVMPISEEGITLSVWAQNRSQGYMNSYNDMLAFQEIEKKTGVKLDFSHPVGTELEQLNIILASGDYPDIIVYYWGNEPLIQRTYKSGVAIELDEYVEKYAPNLKAALASDELYQRQMKLLSEERMLYFPHLIDDVKHCAYDGFFIRQDWLDAVGKQMPATIEEWEDVLTAFRDTDLNQNGQADEIPFSTHADARMTNEVFAGAFGLPAYGYFYNSRTGKISHSVLEPEFKDYLTTMNRWYSEGLVNKNYMSTTGKELDSMVLNNELGAFCGTNNNEIVKYMQMDSSLDFVAAPYPTAKDGKKYHTNKASISTVRNRGAIITTACKYPVEAVRYFDYLYTKEASDLINWGIKDESYTVGSDGEYQFTELISNNPEGKTPAEAICKYMTITGGFGFTQYKAAAALNSDLSDKAKKVIDDSVNYSLETDKSLLLPYMPGTADEKTEIATLSADLSTYMSEMYNKFILGYEPLENYDAFVQQCKDLGIEKIIAIYQTAYDRAMAQ